MINTDITGAVVHSLLKSIQVKFDPTLNYNVDHTERTIVINQINENYRRILREHIPGFGYKVSFKPYDQRRNMSNLENLGAPVFFNFRAAEYYLLKTIKKRRLMLRYNQAYIAKRLDLSQNSYSKLESRQTELSLDRFLHLCEILDLDYNTLITDAYNRYA